MNPLGANTSYDVFLSFSGKDTRNSFTDHLYETLMRSGLRPFRDDDDIERGESLMPEISKAITQSRASIVVLSENYANSTWCLEELLVILEQKRRHDHFVLPVFYRVNPSYIRKQSDALTTVAQTSLKWTDDNVKRWKVALVEVSDLAGKVHSGLETSFLKEIVNIIYDKLDRKEVYLPPNLTGMVARYEEINFWLSETNLEILVIWGMGGSGKTALAKYIYDSNWKKFSKVSFVEDIGTKCKGSQRLLGLQNQILKDILGGKKRKIPSVCRGTSKIEDALKMIKALIVLDDIAEWSQIEALLGGGMINSESKIIITTRSCTNTWFKTTSWKYRQYEMKLLNEVESSELLSRYAFGSKIPMEGFEELVVEAVHYCEGNPLALKILGCLLSERYTIPYWRSQLNLLETDIHSRIEGTLIRSYKSLPYESQKELFLHIACFFIGKDTDYVTKILEPDYFATAGIKTLTNKCLLSVSPNKKLVMHRLIRDMARNIVRRESFKYPTKRSRVWLNSEAYKILSRGMGSETMEGLTLDMQMLIEKEHISESSEIGSDSLQKMNNLKLLQLNFVELQGSYKNFSQDLRWLSWLGFHLRTIPTDLYMGNLVAIDLSYSKLEVFEPPGLLQSLQILNLKDSHNLSEIRDIFRMPNLETLIVWNCHNLVHVCKTIGGLTNLALLNATNCENLCKREITHTIAWLNTSTSRQKLSFNLPQSLQRLFLNGCNLEYTDYFYLSFSDQILLQYLNLGDNFFEFLPRYDHLKNLRVLDCSFCYKLKRLSFLPSTLAELYVYSCTSLEKISFQSPRFTLQELGYQGCCVLSEIEGLFKLVPIANLNETDLGHMKWLKQYQNHYMYLVGDSELTSDRIHRVLQMLYEFNIMSISLPDIKDPNMMPEYISESLSLSFDVPSCPKGRKLKGLNVTCRYNMSTDLTTYRDLPWFVKISTTNGVDLMYNPRVVGVTQKGECTWLSYWPIGNSLNAGDKINVSIVVMNRLKVHGCGASLVYTDEVIQNETLQNDMEWIEGLGGDLSGFQLSTGAYYLCRHNFFELLDVDELTPGWFSILVGDSVDASEVRGWRKTGRPQQPYQSFTELKIVKCIIHSSESEEIYNATEMSEKALFRTSSKSNSTPMPRIPKKKRNAAETYDVASKPVDMTEASLVNKPMKINKNYNNLEAMTISKPFTSNEIKKSISSIDNGSWKSVVTQSTSGLHGDSLETSVTRSTSSVYMGQSQSGVTQEVSDNQFF